LLLGVLLALMIRLVPTRALAAGLAVALLCFSVAGTAAAVRRVLNSDPPTPRHLGADGIVPDWIDGVLPEGASAAAAPFPVSSAWDISALLWWDVEFWNRSVGEVFVGADGRFSYGVPPSRTLALDFATGSVAGTADAPAFLVVAAGDPRFRLAGPRHATNLGLEVIAVERPYRAEWATHGLSVDGWTRPGGPVTIRVFGVPGRPAAPTHVSVQLTAPPARAAYTLATVGTRRAGELAPGETRVEELEVCPPAGGHADIRLVSERAASIPGPPLGPGPAGTRSVGVGLGRIELVRGDGRC
jgi:hypothetical protein